MHIDVTDIETPCYIVDEAALERNLHILDSVQKRTGCKIIMAFKGFAMFAVFPLIRQYLSGVTASSLHEARLGFEEFADEVHVCAPAYIASEFDELLSYSSHMVFNSFSQWNRFKKKIRQAKKDIQCGIRINPEHSEVKASIYDPCAQYSRLGVIFDKFQNDNLDGITGLRIGQFGSSGFIREAKYGVVPHFVFRVVMASSSSGLTLMNSFICLSI